MLKYFIAALLSFLLNDRAIGQNGFPKIFNYTLWDGPLVSQSIPSTNGLIISGFGSNNITGLNISYFVKLDQNGEKVWDTIFDDTQHAGFPGIDDVKMDVDGKKVYFFGTGVFDVYPCIIGINVNLNKVFLKRTYKMAPGKAGGFQDLLIDDSSKQMNGFGFYSPYTTLKNHCFCFYKLDSSGNPLNVKYYCNDTLDFIYKKTYRYKNSDNFIVVSMDENNLKGIILTRLDNNGNIVSIKRPFKTYPLSTLYCLTENDNGEYMLFGKSTVGNYDNIVIRISSDGDSLSSSFCNINGNFVNKDIEGNYIFSNSISLTKMDSSLDLMWYKVLDTTLLELRRVSPTNDGGFWVTGTKTYGPENDSSNWLDMIVYRFDKNGNITGVNDIITNSFSNKLNLFPNPANDKFQVQLPCKEKIIKIYNFQGQLLLTQNDSIIDTSKFENGVYFVSVKNLETDSISIGKVIINH